MQSNNDIIIKIEHLTKRFDQRTIVDNISLDIEKGKSTVIIGPSGCGKTVFIKHINVLLRPTSGKIFFKDQRIDNLRENQLHKYRQQIGYLFQGAALFDSKSVFENIIFPIVEHNRKVSKDELEKIVARNLELVGMNGYQNYSPASLSGGQKKRVALARAIAIRPEVILYDEPTTGLDPIRSDVINELILKMQRELNITSVVVTHDMKSACKIADRILMLHNGRILADGTPDEILNHPHVAVQQFIKGQVSPEDLATLRIGGTIDQ